jgi:heat shock protein HslJ
MLSPLTPSAVVEQTTTFRGEVSCPGCSERWLTLTLFPDKTYRLVERFSQPSNESFYELGTWQTKGQRLRLQSGLERVRQFDWVGEDKLKLLSDNGRHIRSIRHYQLTKQNKVDELRGPMRISGLFRMTDQGPRFQACFTSKDFAVAQQGFGEELARQYAEQQRTLNFPAATPVLVTVTAEFAAQNSGQQELITVHLLDRFWPSRVCPPLPMNASQPLLLTRWLLVELDGKKLDPARVDKPAHLRLMGQGRVQAHSGCNAITARYNQVSDSLRFSQLSTTRMACHGKVADVEQSFLNALRHTSLYEVRGTQLWLIQGDKTLARLLADDMQ